MILRVRDEDGNVREIPAIRGKDGKSVTVSSVNESTEDGGNNVVTFSDGTKLTVKNGKTGAQGLRGSDGDDGYTPVKGKDYYTDGEKAEWSEYIASELAKRGQIKPLFAESVDWLDENGDQSLLYVLPNGMIYAYTTKTVPGGTEEVIETITEGFSDNTRLSVSSGNPTTLSGFTTTPFIDFSKYPIDAEIRLSGINWAADENLTSGYAAGAYDENQAMLVILYTYLGEHADSTYNIKYNAQSATDVVFTLRDLYQPRNFKYVRFSGMGSSANAVVEVAYTVEREAQTVTEWTDTGHAFVPADYEGRIIGLEEGVEEHKAELNNHERRLATLETSTDTPLPEYWADHMAEKADAIQQAMEEAGRNKAAFLWYTDAHWDAGNSKMSPALLQYLHQNTSMVKTNFGGDIIGDPASLNHETVAGAYEWRKAIKALPNHHSVIGNHDNLLKGGNDADVSNLVYAFLLAPEETPDMVKGGDFYYYIDSPCEQTRYLYLDSGRIYLNEDEAQFIIEALTSTPSGWHIVVISHIWFQYTSSSSPTVGEINAHMQALLNVLDAYNSRGAGNFALYYPPQSYDFSKPYDFSACGGKVDFCIGGHIHVDYDLTSTGGIPVILTASDVNQNRSSDEEEDSGTLGTTTEAAVFGIIANYTLRKITVVGVGRGGSRVISY